MTRLRSTTTTAAGVRVILEARGERRPRSITFHLLTAYILQVTHHGLLHRRGMMQCVQKLKKKTHYRRMCMRSSSCSFNLGHEMRELHAATRTAQRGGYRNYFAASLIIPVVLALKNRIQPSRPF